VINLKAKMKKHEVILSFIAVILIIIVTFTPANSLTYTQESSNVLYYKGYSVDGNKVTFGVQTYI